MITRSRAAIYTRVSNKLQVHGKSLDAQLNAAYELAENENLEVIKVEVDGGTSVKTKISKKLRELIIWASENNVQVLIIHSSDRLARTIVGMQELIELLDETGITLRVVADYLPEDPEERKDALLLQSFVAQFSNRERSKHVRKVKLDHVRKGGTNGPIASGLTSLRVFQDELLTLVTERKLSQEDADAYLKQGYQIIHDHQLEKDAVFPDPRISPAILKAYQLYAFGNWSPEDISHYLNDNGYPTPIRNQNPYWSRRTIADILKNPVYRGMTVYKGPYYQGKHPEIISEELWDECQLVHEKRKAGPRSNGNPKGFAFPLAKLLWCPRCADIYTTHRNGNGKRYYRDKRGKAHVCSQRNLLSAEIVEGRILEYLSSIQLPQTWREEILERANLNQDVEEIERKRAELYELLDRKVTLFEFGHLGKVEFLAAREEILGQITALQPIVKQGLEEAAQLLMNAGELLKDATAIELNIIFNIMFEKVYLDFHFAENGYVCAIEPKPALYELMNVAILPNVADFEEQYGITGKYEEGGTDSLVVDERKLTVERQSSCRVSQPS
jgi:DNA invertase Pin-like site-specific DNA recombinase